MSRRLRVSVFEEAGREGMWFNWMGDGNSLIDVDSEFEGSAISAGDISDVKSIVSDLGILVVLARFRFGGGDIDGFLAADFFVSGSWGGGGLRARFLVTKASIVILFEMRSEK